MTAQSAATDLPFTASGVPALEVRHLSVSIGSRRAGMRSVLDDVSFRVMPGEAIGLVGESGSGKSMTALAAVGLLPATAQVTNGEIFLNGTDLLSLNRKELRRRRGGGISMVLQDPLTALDPSFSIGYQLEESLRLHRDMKGSELERESVDLLKKVRIPGASKRLGQYPHELSGGMRQRVCSAIALAAQPDVLIADEPTTALDVTTQAQYLTMLQELQESTGFALILITHDLAIIRQMCQSVIVMYAGQVVEEARPVSVAVDGPNHPYTRGLFESIPKLDPDADLKPIAGNMPEPGLYPTGCRFAPRCGFAHDECSATVPSITERPANGCRARCFGTEPDGWVHL